jgi:signal transduction histidine kinase
MVLGGGFPWLAAGSLFGGVATVALVAYLYPYRERPGARWLLLTLAAQAVFCLSYGVSLFVFAPGPRAALEAVAWLGLSWLGPLFLAFALEYTGRGSLVRSGPFGAVLVVPTVTTFLLLTLPYHDLLWRDFEVVTRFGAAVGRYAFAPWAYVNIIGGTVVAGLGVLLLVETILSYGPLYRREATAVALSTLPPAAGLIMWAFNLGPLPQVNLTAMLFVPHVLLDAYAFGHTEMFESNPTTRRAAERTMTERMTAPIIVRDTEGRVVELNGAARDLFGVERREALGEPFAGLTGEEIADGEILSFPSGERRREFLVSCSALTGPRGTRVGESVVLQDITRQRQQQQRLEVLNRVLRHNLRNEMTVIRGYAATIRESPKNPDVPEWAGTIAESSDRLIDIGAKAREFEEVMDGEVTPTALDVRSLLGDIEADLRAEFPEATIESEVRLGGRTELYTDRRVLGLVLRNLMENALEHNHRPKAEAALHVQWSGAEPDDAVEVAVTDNGPGIPEAELAPIRNETESPLEHGSGIGLWIAEWGTRALNGELSFRTDDDGTVATVVLPREAGPAERV